MPAQSKLSNALAYARYGIRVHPCHEIESDGECSCGKLGCPSAGKHPRLNDWLALATADEAQIRRWWADWPTANVGVATGAGSNLVVLDVDGEIGQAAIRALELEHGELPITPLVLTGGKGGCHYYFAHVPGLRNAIRFDEGLDIRTDGGLVIGAGSIVKRQYRWDAAFTLGNDLQPANMPEWLVNRIKAAKSPAGNSAAFTMPATLPAGQRNDHLYRLARSLKAKGLTAVSALAALQAENKAKCSPPLEENEIAAISAHAFLQPDQADFKANRNEAEPRRGSQATKLVELAISHAAEFFHDGDTAYVSFIAAGHLETTAIPSLPLRRWLGAQYFRETKTSPNGESIGAACNTIAGLALEGEQREVFLRLGERDGMLYLDLCDKDWRCVEIGRTGWRIVQSKDAPRFRRTRAMRALPEPQSGGSFDILKRFCNTPDDKTFLLVVGWLVCAIRRAGPFAILLLQGAAGGAKSSMAHVLRSLIDPNAAPLRAEPPTLRDLAVAAENSWLLAFDNLSHIPAWLSDGLCRISTGAGFSIREHYENREETIFQAKRPCLITSIHEVATANDLLDRSVIVALPEIPAARRLTEQKFNRDFEQQRPLILGALLDAASKALQVHPTLQLGPLPRMADYASFSAAAMSALGETPESFLNAYVANRGDANALTLDASVVAPHIMAIAQLAPGGWRGTATDLLEKVNGVASEQQRKAKEWPDTAISLSNMLRRVIANLRKAGVEVEFMPRDRNRRLIRISQIERQTTETNTTREW